MILTDARKIALTPNFISEVFYLTAAVNHLHFRPVELYLKRIGTDLRNFRERIEAVENDPSWRNVSPGPLLIQSGYLCALGIIQ
jgi:Ubiquitin elongating factor core